MGRRFSDLYAYGLPNLPAAGGVTVDQATTIAQTVQAQALPQIEASSVAAAVRATTAPIPVAIMTADYVAKSDDQRIAHDSASDHTLTPLTAKDAVNRRFVFSNGYMGGKLTLAGVYVTPVASGTAMVTNPVLIPGASVDVIARFVMDPSGTENAPSDLRVDGGSAAAGAKGKYVYDIVARNFGGGDSQTFAAVVGQANSTQQSFSSFLMSYTPSTSPNAPVTKSAAYTCDVNDSEILCDTTTATFAVTLPSGAAAAKVIDVKWLTGTNAPTVAAPSGGSISDGSPFTIPALKSSISFRHRGSNVWDVI